MHQKAWENKQRDEGVLGIRRVEVVCQAKNSHLFQQWEMVNTNIFDLMLERELSGE